MKAVTFRMASARTVCSFTLLLLAWLCVPVPQAHAGVLICKSSYTNSEDRARLSAAMQRVTPPGVRIEGIPNICRNPGRASAWLSTWASPRADGVTEWWTFTCEREARDWRCEAPVRGQLIWVYTEVGGVQRRLEVSFDEAVTPDRARRSAVRAVQIINDPSAVPLAACGSPSESERQREWEKQQRRYALKPADTSVELTVESGEGGVVHVLRSPGDGLGLTFTDGSSGMPTEGRPCWSEWIVVG